MKSVATTLLSSAAVIAMAAPTLALDGVPPDSATTLVAEDGTVVYCVFDITRDEDGTITGAQFTDCPEADLISAAEQAGVMTDVDLDNLTVGDSWVRYYPYSDEQTTITLQRVESGVKTSRYSKPDKGMTTLAAFFTFDANEAGGSSCISVDAFGPDGELYDTFYGTQGKYEKGWGCTDIRPGKSTKGWRVWEVPKRGTVEIVMEGWDVDGEEVFATWVVRP
ncbi:MAG: hypothetical protein PVH07_11320 [Chloroflexota bacterium]|jgi:hypothetical protein